VAAGLLEFASHESEEKDGGLEGVEVSMYLL
jgi:hypothetical protein